MLDSIIHTLKGLFSSTNSLIGIGIAVLALVFFGVIIWVLTIDRRMRGMAEVLENERRKVADLQRSLNNVKSNGPARGYSGVGSDGVPAHSTSNPRLGAPGANRRQQPSIAQQRASARMAQQRQAAHAQQPGGYYDDYDDADAFTPEAQALYEEALRQAQHSRATSETLNFGRGYDSPRALTDPSVSQQQAELYAQARARTDEAFRRARDHYELGTDFSQEQAMREYSAQQEEAYRQYAAQQQAAQQRYEMEQRVAQQQELQRQEMIRQQQLVAQQQAAYAAQQQALAAQQYAAQQQAMQQQMLQQQAMEQQMMQQAYQEQAYRQQMEQQRLQAEQEAAKNATAASEEQPASDDRSQQEHRPRHAAPAPVSDGYRIIETDDEGLTPAEQAARRNDAHRNATAAAADTVSIAQRRNEEQRQAALAAHASRAGTARPADDASSRKARQQAAVEQVASRQAYLKNGDPRPVRPADAAKPTMSLPERPRNAEAVSSQREMPASQAQGTSAAQPPQASRPTAATQTQTSATPQQPSAIPQQQQTQAPRPQQPAQAPVQQPSRQASGETAGRGSRQNDPRIPRAQYSKPSPYASPQTSPAKTGPTLDFLGRERSYSEEPIPVDVQAASSVGLYRRNK